MKAIDYLCIIVQAENMPYVPWRLVYNFGCLSLKIVKLAFHFLSFRLTCRCDTDGV